MSVGERVIGGLQRTVFTPMALGIVVLSVALTAAFVGMLGLISGAPLDVGSRLPYYALAMGVVFVVAIVRLDTPDRDGLTVLVATSGMAVLAFVVVALSVEGVAYTLAEPEEVLTSKLVFYVAAAGLVCTGVVIWALHHWREFATGQSSGI